MTQNYKKEKLSFHYVGAIVSNSSYLFEGARTDFGVDAVIELVELITFKNHTRYFSSGTPQRH